MSEKRASKSLYWLYIIIVFCFVILINYHANSKFVRVDLTENKMYTIDPATKELLQSLSDYVTIELYFSEQLPIQLQKVKDDVEDIVTEFNIYGGDKLKIEWKNPRPNSIDKQSAISYGLEMVRIPIIEKDRETVVKTFSGVAVTYADNVEVIPLVRGTENFEYELIKRISMVLRPERPQVGLLRTDSYESVDQTKELYGELISMLEKEYDFKYIDVLKTTVVDPSISTLIVPGGNNSFWSNPYAAAMVDQFFMKGGKLIVLANRIDVNLSRGGRGILQNSALFAMLEKYGIEVTPELIADVSCGTMPMQQEVEGKMQTYPMEYPFFVKIAPEGVVSRNPALTGFSGMEMNWVSPLKVSDSLPETVIADTLLMSSKHAFTMGEPYNLNPKVYWEKRFKRAEEEGRIKQFPVAIHLHGNFRSLYESDTSSAEVVREVGENDLLVIGNSTFMTTHKVNAVFLKNMTDWLTTNDKLISIRNRTFVDRSFKTGSLVDEKARARVYRVVNLTLMPLLLIIAGLILFTSRKRAQKVEVKK